MADPELEAIRRARMAELRGSGAGGSSAGGSGLGSLMGGDGAGGSSGQQEEQEAKMAQQEEMKRQALSTILDADARDRLSRISLVKPEKARAIQDLLIRMAQSGQMRQRVNEQQLIGLLDQVEGRSAENSGTASKITYNRKKTQMDDDDDFDL